MSLWTLRLFMRNKLQNETKSQNASTVTLAKIQQNGTDSKLGNTIQVKGTKRGDYSMDGTKRGDHSMDWFAYHPIEDIYRSE